MSLVSKKLPQLATDQPSSQHGQYFSSYGVNMACYLMFKSRKADLKMHPLTARLVQYKNLLDELESKLDPIVSSQVQQVLELLDEDGGIKKLKKLASKAKQDPAVKKPK